jgi:CheY-like chemotaxis protein
MSFRVLLVDDEPSILELFKLALELEGFRVETAESGAAAIALLAQHSYDLVITDMRMETPTAGFNVVRAASRQEPRPVIAILSAYYLDREDCRRAGADAIFVKGLPVVSLAESLRRLLEHDVAQKCTPSQLRPAT